MKDQVMPRFGRRVFQAEKTENLVVKKEDVILQASRTSGAK